MSKFLSDDGIIRVKHSFNAGDLITILPGLKQLSIDFNRKIKIYQQLNFPSHYYDGQINSTIDEGGQSVCMNNEIYMMLKPLLENQEYVDSFDIWQGQKVDLDYDLTRDSKMIPMPNGLIHSWPESVFPETSTDLSCAWLKIKDYTINVDYFKDKIIINRTQRYLNPYINFYFLKQHEDNIIFSGTMDEHLFFCNQFNLSIKKLTIFNFYELAQIISVCRFGIFNQSLNFHIADGLKANRVLELCPVFPNTFVTGANGMQFYRQQALEYYFHKLLNKTK